MARGPGAMCGCGNRATEEGLVLLPWMAPAKSGYMVLARVAVRIGSPRVPVSTLPRSVRYVTVLGAVAQGQYICRLAYYGFFSSFCLQNIEGRRKRDSFHSIRTIRPVQTFAGWGGKVFDPRRVFR